MSIVIHNPTAEAVWQAIQQLPQNEIARFKQLLESAPMPAVLPVDENTEWSDEDLRGLDRATAQLIAERFGPEASNYD